MKQPIRQLCVFITIDNVTTDHFVLGFTNEMGEKLLR